MKIWEKDEDKGLPTPPPVPKNMAAKAGEIEAFLGKGTEFDGVLSFDGTIRLDGKLKGKVITDGTLIVGDSAVVEAEILVGHLIVNGMVKGDVKAKERIEILGRGKIVGTIKTPRLKIQEGAMLEGQCAMGQAEPAPPLGEAAQGKKNA